MESNDITEKDGNLFSAKVQAKYRCTEKLSAGLLFGFTSDNEESFFMSGNSGINLGLVGEYKPTPFTYLRIEGGMLSFSNSDHENHAKVFWNGEEAVASRMSIGLSMG